MARYDTVDYMTLVLKGGRGDMSCAGRGGGRKGGFYEAERRNVEKMGWMRQFEKESKDINEGQS